MKTSKILIMALITMMTFNTTYAQSDKSQKSLGIKTGTFKVYGNCGMDKKRIEKNAYTINGVKAANWNEDTQILTLKYTASKNMVLDDVQKKIASAGNDTEKYKADDAVYQSLPECCHYERKKS